MKDLFKYINEYGDYTFDQIKFGEVDALLLCQLVYPKLGQIMGIDGVMTLREIQRHPDVDKLYTDRFFGQMYRDIIDAAASTKRFGQILAGHFREEINLERQMQFAAVTFELGDGSAFISFRGTDEKLTGWKEDLNRGVMEVMPSQKRALEYLNEVAAAKPRADLIVGGHSKGGAQAVYASVMAKESAKSQILSTYSFDGIGLGEKFYRTDKYRAMSNQIKKLVPNKSFVGMLFERCDNCTVVKSRGSSFKQHDFMNWRIDGRQFVRSEGLNPGALKVAKRVNLWIKSMQASEREFLIELANDLVLACKPSTIYDIFSGIPSNIYTVIRSFIAHEKYERKKLLELLIRYTKVGRV